NGALIGGDPVIAKMLEQVRQKHAVPAMAAAVITSKRLQKIATAGIRKWGTNVSVTQEDLWHLGSDTKIMTSTLAAILIEQGKLKWTSTVSEIFPELVDSFYPDNKQVSLLQLLSHRAGLPANLTYSKLLKYGTVQQQRIEAVKKGLSQKPLSAPGSEYLYSNLGYIIAGAMIERVTGISWEDALKKHIFLPLGMESAGFGGLGTPGQIDQPWGHKSSGKPFYTNGPLADNLPALGPSGAVHCSIQDWGKFIQDQLMGAREEGVLLKPQSYQMLQSTHFGGDYAFG
ncbi:MAG: class A beta-lactamase-related serine hydrolase, partial [Desulfobacteraceae bacterium]